MQKEIKSQCPYFKLFLKFRTCKYINPEKNRENPRILEYYLYIGPAIIPSDSLSGQTTIMCFPKDTQKVLVMEGLVEDCYITGVLRRALKKKK